MKEPDMPGKTMAHMATARLFRQNQRGDWTDVVNRVRDALQGYGSGLSSILTGARRTAIQTELPEYQANVEGALRTHEANVQSLMNQYQARWNMFLRQGTTRTTSRTV